MKSSNDFKDQSYCSTIPVRHKNLIIALYSLLGFFNKFLKKAGVKYDIKPSHFLYILILLHLFAAFSCKKEEFLIPKAEEGNTQENVYQDHQDIYAISPFKFLATLTFDGRDNFDNGESNFPQSFTFNTTQDANGDGVNDVEDNLENLINYSIGNNLYGYGRTGLKNRGSNDQRPAVYFHLSNVGSYLVYEYWFYYADNNWLNDHEHDWEKYFVYVLNNSPKYIKISSHNSFQTVSWSSILKENGHPKLGVDGGSHAMKTNSEDGVKIRYTGQISRNNGTLLNGNNKTFPWKIYSNDNNVSGATSYRQFPNIFYYGDPEYSTNSNEYGSPNDAPWIRTEWNNPPMP